MTEPRGANTASTAGSDKLLLTLDEACQALRVSRWQIYELINTRRLPTVRIGRRRFVAPDDLATLISGLREGGDDGR